MLLNRASKMPRVCAKGPLIVGLDTGAEAVVVVEFCELFVAAGIAAALDEPPDCIEFRKAVMVEVGIWPVIII